MNFPANLTRRFTDIEKPKTNLAGFSGAYWIIAWELGWGGGGGGGGGGGLGECDRNSISVTFSLGFARVYTLRVSSRLPRYLLIPGNDILVAFNGPLSSLTCDEFTSLLLSLQMQFNQTNASDEASVQENTSMEHINCNQVLLQNSSAISDCSATWETLLQRESVKQFQQETEQTMNNLHCIGRRSTRMPLTDRREKNRERERKRQTRLKGAFNVLRSVIPDYFSKREPGDRLSRIQTLRLAKKYMDTLHELLETD